MTTTTDDPYILWRNTLRDRLALSYLLYRQAEAQWQRLRQKEPRREPLVERAGRRLDRRAAVWMVEVRLVVQIAPTTEVHHG